MSGKTKGIKTAQLINFELGVAGGDAQNLEIELSSRFFQSENSKIKNKNIFPKSLDKPHPLCYNGIVPRGNRKEELIMDWELIFWCVLGGLAVLFMLRAWLPWNERHDNNPYRYCPKEEDEE